MSVARWKWPAGGGRTWEVHERSRAGLRGRFELRLVDASGRLVERPLRFRRQESAVGHAMDPS